MQYCYIHPNKKGTATLLLRGAPASLLGSGNSMLPGSLGAAAWFPKHLLLQEDAQMLLKMDYG